MDGHNLDHAQYRALLSYLMGLCAINLGDVNGGKAILRRLIDEPAIPGTANPRLAAMATYAGQLGEEDPERGMAMLRYVIDTPSESGQFASPGASAAISLGALMRQTGQVDEARIVFEKAISECEAADRPHPEYLSRLHGNLGNLFYENLEDYPRAADHYAKAVASFDAGGEGGNAARRFQVPGLGPT